MNSQIIVFALIASIFVSCSEKKPEPAPQANEKLSWPTVKDSVPAGQVLAAGYSTPDTLFAKLVQGMSEPNIPLLATCLPTLEEMKRINRGMIGLVGNEKSRDALAWGYFAENRKHANRWIPIMQNSKLVYSHYEGGDSVIVHNGYEFVTKFRVFAKDAGGNPVPLSILRSLVKTPQGYKAWAIFDIDAD